MTLDIQTLQNLKDTLLKDKLKIEEELNRIGKKDLESGNYTPKFNEIGEDQDENASEVEEYTDNLALENSLEKQLKDILEALEKIDSPNYGKCSICNNDIPKERLMAYPSAKNCTQCQ